MPATALLRYRFRDVTQMQNHLHLTANHALFFWRADRPALPGGARVLIEFGFETSEQVTTLRGEVLSRVEGESQGMWLEFPDGRLARRIEGGAESLVGRRQKRFGCDLVCEVKNDSYSTLARLVDVSMSGARMMMSQRIALGATVQLRLVAPDANYPATLGRAKVVRFGGQDLGVAFDRTDPVARVATSKLLAGIQQSWQNAIQLMHPHICCQNGQVLEPPMPHVKGRG